MPRRVVEVDGRTYVFSPDDQPPLGGRLWALVRARLIDEMTGQPPAGPITLVSDMSFASPRVASDGIVGLIGIPQQSFPRSRGKIILSTSWSRYLDTFHAGQR